MNDDKFRWFQWVSINLGVAGVLFFLLFVGYIPSPIVGKIDAHAASTDELIRTVHELNRTIKVLCALTANAQKVDPSICYSPPRGGVGP